MDVGELLRLVISGLLGLALLAIVLFPFLFFLPEGQRLVDYWRAKRAATRSIEKALGKSLPEDE